ncbi:hypothetical protein HAX54_001185 [Datura stramonium]|uniref:Uncharacterized protein n=1 Tax=Datura stramonium TaxID=4076 RepID=A0ABS8WSZ3_DATST|nr:hypothetical protein [Datura stramonium]
MSVRGEPDIDRVHPEIQLSAAEYNFVMPPPSVTSEEPLAEPAPQGARSSTSAPCLAPVGPSRATSISITPGKRKLEEEDLEEGGDLDMDPKEATKI